MVSVKLLVFIGLVLSVYINAGTYRENKNSVPWPWFWILLAISAFLLLYGLELNENPKYIKLW